MKVGDLITRSEAPTVVYRVTSKMQAGVFRALPYQRSGREVVVMTHKGMIIGDGSKWSVQ